MRDADFPAEGGPDAGDGVYHDANQCPVAEADQIAAVDAVEEMVGLVGGEHGGARAPAFQKS